MDPASGCAAKHTVIAGRSICWGTRPATASDDDPGSNHRRGCLACWQSDATGRDCMRPKMVWVFFVGGLGLSAAGRDRKRKEVGGWGGIEKCQESRYLSQLPPLQKNLGPGQGTSARKLRKWVVVRSHCGGVDSRLGRVSPRHVGMTRAAISRSCTAMPSAMYRWQAARMRSSRRRRCLPLGASRSTHSFDGFADVLAKHRDVDVLGEPRNQPECFG